MTEATLSIGEVADHAGCSVSAIRFYERRGLMPEPERVWGQRRYTGAAVRRLGMIATAKRAGFTLAEIGALLGAVDRGAPAHEQLRALSARKLPLVEARIAEAEAMRGWLTAAGECECATLDACALFSTEA